MQIFIKLFFNEVETRQNINKLGETPSVSPVNKLTQINTITVNNKKCNKLRCSGTEFDMPYSVTL